MTGVERLRVAPAIELPDSSNAPQAPRHAPPAPISTQAWL
ncbi:MAG: hypothetical protein RLZZ237_3308 [Pseudomonadota bacterium]|jgi:hypothetical protein